MKKYLLALVAFVSISCSRTELCVERTDALPDAAWEQSEWISVADAPVVTDTVYDGSRAADGANWFVASIAAEKPVQSLGADPLLHPAAGAQMERKTPGSEPGL